MLDYQKLSWIEGLDPPGKLSTLAFSQARKFHMSDAPQRRLTVSMAAQRQSGANMFRIFSSGHEIELVDEGSLTVMLPRRGLVVVQDGSRERIASDGGVLAFGPSRRKTCVKPPIDGLFEACLLKLPIFHPLLGEGIADGPGIGYGDPFVKVRDDAVPALSNLISYILSDLASNAPVLTSDPQAELVDVLVDEHIRKLFDADNLAIIQKCNTASAGLFRLAYDYMRTYYNEPMSVGKIADVIGVGTRQLQGVFKSTTGRTPWDHLTEIRLENARRRLLAGVDKATVGRIAMDCGFTHLGRFAALYQSTYNEAPSITLRRFRKLDRASGNLDRTSSWHHTGESFCKASRWS
ncbi:MAG: AraC family transcriptional regulator [Nitrospirales bacterium]|nr:MAG: AraC family transcriptional regulator [Nitrospirales bacterium]